jgi:hypothetical protein
MFIRIGLRISFYFSILFISTTSCSKKNNPLPQPVSGASAESYLTDGPWEYLGTTIPGYPVNLYDSLFFYPHQMLNEYQYVDSLAAWYTGTRIVIYTFGEFRVSRFSNAPDTITSLFNPYTAGPTATDTFLVKTLNDTLMVWGWYMGSKPPGYEIKYDSLRKLRKY